LVLCQGNGLMPGIAYRKYASLLRNWFTYY
jgi:hypothetical protein